MSSQVGVSNTEAQNGYACEGAWGFGFHPEMNFQLRDMGFSRRRGIIGHSALETFYKGIQQEDDYDSCAQRALDEIQKLRVKEMLADDFADPAELKMLNFLYSILQRYFEHYRSDIENWEILGVETFYAQEQPEEVDFYLPSRLDLVVYQKAGQFRGETSPVDHKFVTKFFTKAKLRINSQFPLYILALRAARFAGKPEPVVRRVIVNQIRTYWADPSEKSAEDLFRRDLEPYSSIKLRKVFENHMKMALRLAYFKRISWEEFLEEAKFSFGSMACGYCDFKDICDITFEGGDPSNVIAATLKKNEYGYPPLEEIRRGLGTN